MTNRTQNELGTIPVLLLVGGLGTRLRPVLSDKPKPLAPLGDISFLELLVLQLRAQGLRRLVMCSGFQSGQIRQEFGDGRNRDVFIEHSEETHPLGTAGAIKNAERLLADSKSFVAMNGDSFLELDLPQMIEFHRNHGGVATLAVRRVHDAARYGTVNVDSQNKVTSFKEKTGLAEPGLINGGVYVFNRSVFQSIPDGPRSLEKDVLPHILELGVLALEQNGMFIDIGTPEDYARAKAMQQKLTEAAGAVSSASQIHHP
jgi:NDP-sugar pyrophosphorylase family protein